jgi:hypothetical protein
MSSEDEPMADGDGPPAVSGRPAASPAAEESPAAAEESAAEEESAAAASASTGERAAAEADTAADAPEAPDPGQRPWFQIPPGLVGALRRALPAAILAAVIVALPVGAVGYAVGAAQDRTYSAAAVFRVVARAPEVDSVSTNPRLTAEQSMRTLRSGRAGEYADQAAAGEDYSAEWVLGPGPDEISYTITTDDPDTARKIADRVYQAAGYAGANLRKPGGPRPLLFGTGVTAPTDNQPSAVAVAALPAAGAGGTAGLLVLLAAVRPRRPR